MKLGVLADLHWSVSPDAAGHWHVPYDFDALAMRCTAAIGALTAQGCEVLVVAGDLTHEGDEASCEAALDCVLSRTPVPVAVVAGNHDVLLDPDLVSDRCDVREAWRSAVAAANGNLVALRAVGVGPDATPSRDGGVDPVAGDGLATVVISHYPLVSGADRLAAAGLPAPGELAGRGLVLDLLTATRTPTVVLSGHVHARDAVRHENVLQISVPALIEPPHEGAVVDVDPVAGTVRCSRVGGSAAPEGGDAMPWLLAPADERWQFASGSWTRLEGHAAQVPVLAEERW